MIPKQIAIAILSIAKTKLVYWALVTIVLLLIGTFMDTTPAILILTPILLPIAKEFNIDPVVFGVVMVVNLGIGLVTPPVGLNLFVASGLAKVSVDKVINKNTFLYLGCAMVILILLMIFPDIIMLLPRMMRTMR